MAFKAKTSILFAQCLHEIITDVAEVFLLPATRWPLLDLLAAIERHVLPQRVKGKHHSCIMEPSVSTSGVEFLHTFGPSLSTLTTDHTEPPNKKDVQ